MQNNGKNEEETQDYITYSDYGNIVRYKVYEGRGKQWGKGKHACL